MEGERTERVRSPEKWTKPSPQVARFVVASVDSTLLNLTNIIDGTTKDRIRVGLRNLTDVDLLPSAWAIAHKRETDHANGITLDNVGESITWIDGVQPWVDFHRDHPTYNPAVNAAVDALFPGVDRRGREAADIYSLYKNPLGNRVDEQEIVARVQGTRKYFIDQMIAGCTSEGTIDMTDLREKLVAISKLIPAGLVYATMAQAVITNIQSEPNEAEREKLIENVITQANQPPKEKSRAMFTSLAEAVARRESKDTTQHNLLTTALPVDAHLPALTGTERQAVSVELTVEHFAALPILEAREGQYTATTTEGRRVYEPPEDIKTERIGIPEATHTVGFNPEYGLIFSDLTPESFEAQPTKPQFKTITAVKDTEGRILTIDALVYTPQPPQRSENVLIQLHGEPGSFIHDQETMNVSIDTFLRRIQRGEYQIESPPAEDEENTVEQRTARKEGTYTVEVGNYTVAIAYRTEAKKDAESPDENQDRVLCYDTILAVLEGDGRQDLLDKIKGNQQLEAMLKKLAGVFDGVTNSNGGIASEIALQTFAYEVVEHEVLSNSQTLQETQAAIVTLFEKINARLTDQKSLRADLIKRQGLTQEDLAQLAVYWSENSNMLNEHPLWEIQKKNQQVEMLLSKGFSTTATVDYLWENQDDPDDVQILTTHIGDSEASLLHSGNLSQRTLDDTRSVRVMTYDIDNNDFAAKRQKQKELKNNIQGTDDPNLQRCLGMQAFQRLDVQTYAESVVEGDLELVTTDGFSGALTISNPNDSFNMQDAIKAASNSKVVVDALYSAVDNANAEPGRIRTKDDDKAVIALTFSKKASEINSKVKGDTALSERQEKREILAELFAEQVTSRNINAALPEGTTINGKAISQAGGFYSHGEQMPVHQSLYDLALKVSHNELSDFLNAQFVSVSPQDENNSVLEITLLQDKKAPDSRGYYGPVLLQVALPKASMTELLTKIKEDPDLLEAFYQKAFSGLDSTESRPGMRRNPADRFYLFDSEILAELPQDYTLTSEYLKNFFRAQTERQYRYQQGPYGSGDMVEAGAPTPEPDLEGATESDRQSELQAREQSFWSEKLGADVEIPQLPPELTEAVREKLQSLGMEVIAMPGLEIGTIEELQTMGVDAFLARIHDIYPKLRIYEMLTETEKQNHALWRLPEKHYWEEVSAKRISFPDYTGKWVAIETVKKPEFGTPYDKTPIEQLLGITSRLSYSWESITNLIQDKQSDLLVAAGLTPESSVAIRLPTVPERNLVGNRYDLDRNYLEEWTSTLRKRDLSEWHSEGFNSITIGLDNDTARVYLHSLDQGDEYEGFRLIVDFSQGKQEALVSEEARTSKTVQDELTHVPISKIISTYPGLAGTIFDKRSKYTYTVIDRFSSEQTIQGIEASEQAVIKNFTMTEEERRRFKERLSINGDPFPVAQWDVAEGGVPSEMKHLTSEDLEYAGLLPVYEVASEGAVIRFSRPYDSGERVAVMGYIQKTDGSSVARSFYLSQSQGLWRYLPRYLPDEGGTIRWYSKGYGEQGINLPIAFQESLNVIFQREHLLNVNGNPSFYFAGTARNLISQEQGTYVQEVDAVPQFLGFEVPKDGQNNDRVMKLPPEAITFDSNPQDKPDFSSGSLLTWKQQTTLYGQIDIEVYSSPSGLRYLFCTDSTGRVWIGGVENTNKITSLGVRNRWIEPGDLATPAYEYWHQAATYGNEQKREGLYIDMFDNYISRIPLIQEYLTLKAELSESPPPIEQAKEKEPQLRISIEGDSIAGEISDKHPENQDAFWVDTSLKRPGAVVCDGMGGYKGGTRAAQVAVYAVRAGFAQKPNHQTLQAAKAWVSELILNANYAISVEKQRQTDPLPEEAGTTITVTDVWENPQTGERILIEAKIGDTRGSLLRDGELTDLSPDHSVYRYPPVLENEKPKMEQDASGRWKYVFDFTHPRSDAEVMATQKAFSELTDPTTLSDIEKAWWYSRNFILLALDGSDLSPKAISIKSKKLLPGDIVVIRTDGVTDELTDTETVREIESSMIRNEGIRPRLLNQASKRRHEERPPVPGTRELLTKWGWDGSRYNIKRAMPIWDKFNASIQDLPSENIYTWAENRIDRELGIFLTTFIKEELEINAPQVGSKKLGGLRKVTEDDRKKIFNSIPRETLIKGLEFYMRSILYSEGIRSKSLRAKSPRDDATTVMLFVQAE